LNARVQLEGNDLNVETNMQHHVGTNECQQKWRDVKHTSTCKI